MKTGYIILLVAGISVVGGAWASDDLVKQNVEALLNARGRTNVYSEVVAHEAVLVQIKTFSDSGSVALRLKALTTLVNMGDTNAINKMVHEFGEASNMGRVRFQRELERYCSQTSLIPYLAVDLYRDEESKLQFVDHEYFVEPKSVVAARIILAIILKSEQIPENNKVWAGNIDTSDAKMLRSEIRRWCRQNMTQLVSREFKKIVPLEVPK